MAMNSKNKKNPFLKLVVTLGLAIAPTTNLYAETYLTVDQAKQVMWEQTAMQKVPVKLTKEQMKSIKKASGTRVRDEVVHVWKTSTGGWFIVDQVVGKHEMIDFAVALTKDGKVKDVEVLEYRETYGSEVKNPKWLAQFFGKDYKTHFEIDENVKNISGATLSSVHITDGVNRLMHTWEQVLRHM